jgi:sugar-specific transcriptional regulator TrmB
MNAATELRDSLRRAGLTTYESEAYLALLSRRELTAEDVARLTPIPITRVYGTLEQLMQKGFAKIVQSRPKRFLAVPPGEAKRDYLTQLRQSFEQNLLSIEEIMRTLQRQVEPIYVESHLQVKAEELLEPLDNLKTMEKRTSEYIENASGEVLISTALFSWVPKIRLQMRNALRRGVEERILLQLPHSQVRKYLSELIGMGAQIRDTGDPWHPVRGTLVDDSDLVFVIWAAEEADRHWNPIVYTPNHTKNPGLIRIFRESFFFRWENAKRVKEAKTA